MVGAPAETDRLQSSPGPSQKPGFSLSLCRGPVLCERALLVGLRACAHLFHLQLVGSTLATPLAACLTRAAGPSPAAGAPRRGLVPAHHDPASSVTWSGSPRSLDARFGVALQGGCSSRDQAHPGDPGPVALSLWAEAWTFTLLALFLAGPHSGRAGSGFPAAGWVCDGPCPWACRKSLEHILGTGSPASALLGQGDGRASREKAPGPAGLGGHRAAPQLAGMFTAIAGGLSPGGQDGTACLLWPGGTCLGGARGGGLHLPTHCRASCWHLEVSDNIKSDSTVSPFIL